MSKNRNRNKKNSGLGDTVAHVTKALGIQPCSGCEKRKDMLNVLFPFHKVKPMQEEHKEWFGKFMARKAKTLNQEEAKQITDIYAYCFSIDMSGCSSCSGSLYKTMINKLEKVYQNS